MDAVGVKENSSYIFREICLACEAPASWNCLLLTCPMSNTIFLGKVLLGLGAKSKSRWHFSPERTWDPVLELSSPALRVHRCKDEGISNRIKVIVVIKLLAAVLVFVWDFSPASPSHCLWEPFNWSEVILIANPIVCFLSRTNFYLNFQFNWTSWTLSFLCFSRLFVLSRSEKHQQWHFTIFTNTSRVLFIQQFSQEERLY